VWLLVSVIPEVEMTTPEYTATPDQPAKLKLQSVSQIVTVLRQTFNWFSRYRRINVRLYLLVYSLLLRVLNHRAVVVLE